MSDVADRYYLKKKKDCSYVHVPRWKKRKKNAKELKEGGEGNGSDVNFDICVV